MQSKRKSSFSAESNLKTIVVLAAGILALSFIVEWRWGLHWRWVPTVTLMLLLIGAFSEWLTAKIAWVWLQFAELLGKVNSKVILSVAFFLVLTPLALVRRLFTRNALDLKRGAGDTLYHTRNHEYTAADLENPW